ncbi:filamentous hemagglutinin N-terminal domain-containing protein [Magnetospirillum moscoviense]|uniref:two-partner secretion domain-containing protein n=1 Tax=Magnetospirillum moscoviense TaxID=1437059 RepID=UPI0009EDA13F|nr:filamentous hemagglutinin N-terminal domain-containing protein [Magnetospirillum moscoviense]
MTTRSRHAPLRHASKASPLRRWLTTTTALAGVLPVLMIAVPALANPQGGSVVEGQATITTAPNQLTVNQASDKAVINWQSFSIGAGETTRFVQPSASSIALNRVTGDQVSQILGTLTANGRVILVNPNGVFFGKDSRIDVAALVASTHDIKNSEFMAGRLNFDIPGKIDAQIINEGSLSAKDGGLVALVAPSLRNSGIISARLGRVALASAGSGVTVDLYGDNLILFQADSKLAQQVKGPDGQPVAGLIDNSGQIYADGGRVLLTANAAKGVVDKAINMTGIVQARTVEQQGGEIVLKGDDGGVVEVAGKLDASGKEAGQKGGIVHVLGEVAALTDSARIDVSGDAGGGTALVGGDYLGKGAVRNADVTYMAKGAQINASALTNGDGGKAILWADHTTRSYGKILALGGWGGGNGGFVETSGKVYLHHTGRVDTSAAKGLIGTWFLDPSDLTISDGATQTNVTTTCSSIDCSDPGNFYGTNDSGAAQVSTDSIAEALNSGQRVTIFASGNVVISDIIMSTSGSSSSKDFYVIADGSISMINGAYISASDLTTSGSFDVKLQADYNSDGVGDVTIGRDNTEQHTYIFAKNGNITLIGANVTLANSSSKTSYNTLYTGTGAVSVTATNTITLYDNAIASKGNITLNAPTISAFAADSSNGTPEIYRVSGNLSFQNATGAGIELASCDNCTIYSEPTTSTTLTPDQTNETDKINADNKTRLPPDVNLDQSDISIIDYIGSLVGISSGIQSTTFAQSLASANQSTGTYGLSADKWAKVNAIMNALSSKTPDQISTLLTTLIGSGKLNSGSGWWTIFEDSRWTVRSKLDTALLLAVDKSALAIGDSKWSAFPYAVRQNVYNNLVPQLNFVKDSVDTEGAILSLLYNKQIDPSNPNGSPVWAALKGKYGTGYMKNIFDGLYGQANVQSALCSTCGAYKDGSVTKVTGTVLGDVVDTVSFKIGNSTIALSSKSNGGYLASSIGSSDAYQCTDIVRDYMNALGMDKPDITGNGNRSASVVASKGPVYLNGQKIHFEYNSLSSDIPPKVGAVLSQGNGNNPHVSIVKSVEPLADGSLKITLIENNVGTDGNEIANRELTFNKGDNGEWVVSRSWGNSSAFNVIGWSNPVAARS